MIEIKEVIQIISRNIISLYLLLFLLIFFTATLPSIGNIFSRSFFLFLFLISLLFLIPWMTDVELAFTLGINTEKYMFIIIIINAKIMYFISNTNLK